MAATLLPTPLPHERLAQYRMALQQARDATALDDALFDAPEQCMRPADQLASIERTSPVSLKMVSSIASSSVAANPVTSVEKVPCTTNISERDRDFRLCG